MKVSANIRRVAHNASLLLVALVATTVLLAPHVQAIGFGSSTASSTIQLDFWRGLYRAPWWQVDKGPNHTDAVVLTYDDCPNSAAEFKAFVDAAEQMQVTTALFPIEWCGSAFDASYARAHGQLVAGHSKTHPNLTTLSAAQIQNEIDFHSREAGVMRPPHGATNATVESVFAANNIRMWNWSLYTTDWTKEPRATTLNTIVTQAVPGDTVLLHMSGNMFNPTALAETKNQLQSQRGLRLCDIRAGRSVNAQGTRIPNGINC